MVSSSDLTLTSHLKKTRQLLVVMGKYLFENVYNYLLALQRNRESILENPKEWMPWNYRDKVAVLSQKNKPDK